ncbi:MAG: RagB/SusD family nutrient uptake outer membrane protein [Bacteroidales bacterium]|nr:RagB/SusD family nutrient uptake outer membrane protein [Bacteroidales bacterium]
MKKSIFLSIILSGLLFVSCTDLTETVYSDIPMDQFFTSEKALLMNAGRAYTKLQPYPEEQKLWSLMTVSSDECVIPAREDGEWWDNGRWDEIQMHNVSSANKINRQAWEFVFGGITACNEVLYETESSPYDFPGKNKIMAEIKVLRALFYYWGMDAWGDIPFATDFTDKTLPPKKSRAFIYDFVEKEVKDNISYLDEVPTSENYGRVTKGMAFTLLAKLYLNANVWKGTPHWDDAEKMCDSVINKNHYQLENNYFDNFKINNESSKENIFVIVYNSTMTTEYFYWYDLTLNSMSRYTYNLNDTPWDGFMTTPDFFKSYSDTDKRKKSWLYGQQYDATGKKLFEIAGTGDTLWFAYNPDFPESKYKSRHKWDGARCAKYEFQTSGLQYDVVDMENDFVLFRYADVVMMKVECMMRQNRTAEAVELPDFKTLRTRVGLAPYTVSELTLNELLSERGREFAWEGHRRQDLLRFEKWNDKWWGKPYTTTQRVFPIPQTAVDTNPNLAGNAQ